jgi:hypothetical protein
MLSKFYKIKIETKINEKEILQGNLIVFRLFQGKQYMEINRAFGKFFENFLINQYHFNDWRSWDNRTNLVIPNYYRMKDKLIIETKFDFIFQMKKKYLFSLKKGVWHMITIKFYESR